MFNRRLISVSIFGLLIYAGTNILWGCLYYFTGTLKFSSGTLSPDFWHCIYFSFVTSATIGYGDIIPISQLGQLSVIIQSMVSILFVGIFGGYMAYLFLKRPDNILISRFIIVKPQSGNIFFTLRVGNKGKELNNARLEIGFVEIKNDVKHTRHNTAVSYSLLEKSWHPAINMTDGTNQAFTTAFKSFYNNPDTMLIRVMVTGNDLQSGETIGLFKFFKVSDVKISGKFIDIYHWINLERTRVNWKDFDKTQDITELEKQEVVAFLQHNV